MLHFYNFCVLLPGETFFEKGLVSFTCSWEGRRLHLYTFLFSSSMDSLWFIRQANVSFGLLSFVVSFLLPGKLTFFTSPILPWLYLVCCSHEHQSPLSSLVSMSSPYWYLSWLSIQAQRFHGLTVYLVYFFLQFYASHSFGCVFTCLPLTWPDYKLWW